MLNRGRVTCDGNISSYCMPSLQSIVREGAADLSLGQRADEIEREAYERGFEEGEKAGFTMGELKAAVLAKRLEKIIEELTTLTERLVKEIEPQVVELAVTIARKIILSELSVNPGRILEITKEALLRLERRGQITIKINSSLYDLFEKHKPELLTVHPDIVFEVDPSAPLYGPLVIGPSGEVVTDIDDQLRNILKDLGV